MPFALSDFNPTNQLKKNSILLLFFLIVLSYFPLFLHLDTMPFMIWDESRLGVSALEMLKNDNYVVVTYGNNPDLWSVKPPLMIWIIALSYKVLGFNALALRLPSALFGLLTVISVYRFCEKVLNNHLLGFFSALILITTNGYIDYHITRTGDYDSLLILCQTLSIFYFVKHYLQDNARLKIRFLWISTFCLSLALLTKGIAGLLFLPALMLFLFSENRLKEYVFSKNTYIALLITILPITTYMCTREFYSSGYFQAIWENEFLNRYLYGDGDDRILHLTFIDKLEYYIGKLFNSDMNPWFYLLPIGILASFKEKNLPDFKVYKLFFISVFVFLVLITFSNSKKEWYEAPIYPILSILVGKGVFYIFNELFEILNAYSSKILQIVIGFLLLCFLFMPYYRIIDKFNFTVDNQFDWEKRVGSQFMLKSKKYLPFCIMNKEYNASINLSRSILESKGQNKVAMLSIYAPSFQNLIKTGDKMMICEEEEIDSVKKYFKYRIIEEFRTCKLVEIQTK